MGCFSFMCKECGKAILSNSFSGQECYLFLLKGGKVIQQMTGQYDSYGRTFIPGSQRPDIKHPLMESQEWKTVEEGEHDAWSGVCKLMHNGGLGDGIAAVHVKCFREVPATRSEDDPNQGWGDDDELMGDIDPEYEYSEEEED